MTSLAAILLAAGCSERFGAENKLLAKIDGVPMVRHAAQALVDAACFRQVVVVTGYEAKRIEAALSGLPVHFSSNANWRTGLGSSIAHGISQCSNETKGALIALSDMPFQNPALLRRLVSTFEASNGQSIVFPVTPSGRQRNPVLWPRRFFGLLRRLNPAEGAKHLLVEYVDACRPVVTYSTHMLRDIDDQRTLNAVVSGRDETRPDVNASEPSSLLTDANYLPEGRSYAERRLS